MVGQEFAESLVSFRKVLDMLKSTNFITDMTMSMNCKMWKCKNGEVLSRKRYASAMSHRFIYHKMLI
jgi:hypothetical protein